MGVGKGNGKGKGKEKGKEKGGSGAESIGHKDRTESPWPPDIFLDKKLPLQWFKSLARCIWKRVKCQELSPTQLNFLETTAPFRKDQEMCLWLV